MISSQNGLDKLVLCFLLTLYFLTILNFCSVIWFCFNFVLHIWFFCLNISCSGIGRVYFLRFCTSIGVVKEGLLKEKNLYLFCLKREGSLFIPCGCVLDHLKGAFWYYKFIYSHIMYLNAVSVVKQTFDAGEVERVSPVLILYCLKFL